MATCNGCGGVVGRDCFNPSECEWIARDMERREAQERAESVAREVAKQEAASQSGMTLRDAMAIAALQGLCANPGGPFQACDRSGWRIVNCEVGDIAREAYGLADAMLRAREAK